MYNNIFAPCFEPTSCSLINSNPQAVKINNSNNLFYCALLSNLQSYSNITHDTI